MMHNRRDANQRTGVPPAALPTLVYPNPEDPGEGIDRRQFLALAGASAALAGVVGMLAAAGSLDDIVPYVRPPEGLEPGTPLTFATAMELGGAGLGLLVASREGRPIKIEGNPDHPGSLGATDLFSQAALLDLYDPDRSGAVIHRGTPSTWDAALAELRAGLQALEATQGAGLRILTGAVGSPHARGADRRPPREGFPRPEWVRHEPAGEAAAAEGAAGPSASRCRRSTTWRRPTSWSRSTPISSGAGRGRCRYQHDFAGRRRVRAAGQGVAAGDMNRLYAVECMLTTTGASADHRLALRPGEVESFARGAGQPR